MKIAAIICEFNPFSKGHKYLIDSVRQDLNPDAVVCIMSGNYVQRGQIAVENKWKRAGDALNNGADLVVQLPVCVSLSSAKYFAKGGVDIAEKLNADYLCFGTTSGNLSEIYEMSENGIDGIEDGNNILACEYIRNLNSEIKPWTLKIDDSLGHASDDARRSENIFDNYLFKLEQYVILNSTETELARIAEVSEGLENRIVKALPVSRSHEELLHNIKSKRYTYTRISRIMLQMILGIENNTVSEPYLNVLGFNSTGRAVLKQAECPVYSGIKPENLKDNKNLFIDKRADDIYNSITGNDLYSFSDFVCKPCKTNI